MKVGDRVYSRDDVLEEIGIVVEPTNDEIREASLYEYPIGLEHGDTMVEWDYARFWERLEDLEKVDNDDDN